MKIEAVEQAVELTLLGLSTAFVAVIGLMVLIFAFGRLLQSKWFKGRTLNLMRNRAEEKGMAAALGVGLMLAQDTYEARDNSQ